MLVTKNNLIQRELSFQLDDALIIVKLYTLYRTGFSLWFHHTAKLLETMFPFFYAERKSFLISKLGLESINKMIRINVQHLRL
jgi:hypothetical protein